MPQLSCRSRAAVGDEGKDTVKRRLLAQSDRLFRTSGCFVWLRTFPASFAIMLAAFRYRHRLQWLACGHVDTVCVWRVAAAAVRWRKPFANSILRSVGDSPLGHGKWRVRADTACRVEQMAANVLPSMLGERGVETQRRDKMACAGEADRNGPTLVLDPLLVFSVCPVPVWIQCLLEETAGEV